MYGYLLRGTPSATRRHCHDICLLQSPNMNTRLHFARCLLVCFHKRECFHQLRAIISLNKSKVAFMMLYQCLFIMLFVVSHKIKWYYLKQHRKMLCESFDIAERLSRRLCMSITGPIVTYQPRVDIFSMGEGEPSAW